MISIRDDFQESLLAGSQIVLMPVSRLIIDEGFRIDPFVFYPAGVVDLRELRTIPNRSLFSDQSGPLVSAQGQEARETFTSLTGATVATLEQHALVGFPQTLEWEDFLNADHRQDIKLIRKWSELAEQAMSVVKFNYCAFNAPHAVPGRVGTWNGSGEYSCALVYNLQDHESWLIAGSTVISAVVVKGLGLELDAEQCRIPMELPMGGEVGQIACHGFSLLSDVLDSNTDTTKFARVMTLLDMASLSWQDFLKHRWQKRESLDVNNTAIES